MFCVIPAEAGIQDYIFCHPLRGLYTFQIQKLNVQGLA